MNKKKTFSFGTILIYIVPLLFIGLTIIFLWKEKLDLHSKINDQKVTNFFITVLTSVGTIFSVYYLKRQVEETNLGRKTSIIPDIMPEDAVFEVTEDNLPSLATGSDLPGISIKNLTNDSYHINLLNIGVGIAKNIEAKWLYNREEVLAQSNNIYYNSYFDEPFFISFLKPSRYGLISPSMLYMTCCGPKLNHDFLDIMDDHIVPKPDLSLYLKYYDLQDNLYEKTFKVRVDAVTDRVTFGFIDQSKI
jgi:hypothetical protein